MPVTSGNSHRACSAEGARPASAYAHGPCTGECVQTVSGQLLRTYLERRVQHHLGRCAQTLPRRMGANLFGHVRADLTWAMRATLPGQDMRTIVSTMDLFKWRRSPSKTGESVLAKIGNWQLAMGFASSLHGPPAPGRDDAIDADLVEPRRECGNSQ